MFKKFISEVAAGVGSAVGTAAGIVVGGVVGIVAGGCIGYKLGDNAGRNFINPPPQEVAEEKVINEPPKRGRAKATA